MVNFYNVDCVEFMKSKPDKCYDLAIVDPPYGIDINPNMGRKKGKAKKHSDISWDAEIPTDEYFKELFRVSVNQVIWGGGNYFPLPPTKHVIFWDKMTPEGLSFSDGELAWTSFNKAIKKWTMRNVTGDKIHPTQKPIQLYRWLLRTYAEKGMKILDTHGGSMSIAIACNMEGFNLDICEINTEYFNAGVKRFENHKKQGVLFAPEQIKPEQTKLIL